MMEANNKIPRILGIFPFKQGHFTLILLTNDTYHLKTMIL